MSDAGAKPGATPKARPSGAAASPAAPVNRPSIFQYPIEACGVSDPAKLTQFRQKLEQWSHFISGDPNSLAGQFGEMMWYDIAWRAANEARRFAEDDGTKASVAPLIAMMLDRGYVAGQVIAITRLLEYSNPKQPNKGVVSLKRMVDEMRDARELITRENFVSHDALPYDWEAMQEAALAKVTEQLAQSGGKAIRTELSLTGPEGFDQARMQHELFDQLSGVAPADRARGDLIATSFFDRLDDLLGDKLLLEIKELRNKSIAHAADAFSRSRASALRSGLSLKDFDRAHYLLFAVFQTLSVVLLGQWRASPVPTGQQDMFEYLTTPFLSEQRLEAMSAFWKAHCQEREDWMTRAFHEILPKDSGVKEAPPEGGA